MKEAKPQIDRLSPTRYILCTSQRLTPGNKDTLKSLMEPHILSTNDIWGKDDLNALLRKFPEVEKNHHKLWLHSSGVLSRLLNNATTNRTSQVVDEIERANQVFVSHQGYVEAQQVIDVQKVLIVAGPPGVGKTTLSLVIASRYLEDDWEILAISNIREALDCFDKTKKQLFLFDDFLGTIKFDQMSLSKSENDFKRFVSMVKKHPANKRFILTTRKYILAEARISSEALSDEVIRLSDVVIDLKSYSEKIKAKVLYNHLYFSNLDQKHITALINSGRLMDIIRHKNYMPRLIQWLTDADRLSECKPEEYAAHFLMTLAQPGKIWEHAVTQHLDIQARLLLFCLFLEPYSYIKTVHKNWFDATNLVLARDQNYQVAEGVYEDALKILEGSFIEVGGWRVTFVNPSLQDFLSNKLKTSPLLAAMASSVASQEQALKIWRFLRFEKGVREGRLKEIYRSLKGASLSEGSDLVNNVSVCQFIEYAHSVLDVLGAEDDLEKVISEDKLAEQDSDLLEFPRFFEGLDDGVYEHLDAKKMRNYLSERFVTALEECTMDFDDFLGFLGEVESVSPDLSDDETASIDETTAYIVQNTELPDRDADERERLATMLDEINLLERWSSSRAPDELRQSILRRFNDIDAEHAYQEEHAIEEFYLQGPSKQRKIDPTLIVPSLTGSSPATPRVNVAGGALSDAEVTRMFSGLIDSNDEST